MNSKTINVVVFFLFYLFFVIVSYESFSVNNFANSTENGDCDKSPVIMIPGLGGSRIEAKLKKPKVPHWWCYKNSNYFNLWLSMDPVLSFDCWVDNVKLSYNNCTRKTENSPGVKTRVPGWNQTIPIEFIGKYNYGAFFYFIVDALVKQGYVRDESIFGAPYDFRKGPNENKYWFKVLKYLTEYAYSSNNNISVTFISYSMGGRMLLHFLQQMPQTWKDKYVKSVISIAVPWGGSVRAIQALSVGYNLDIPILSTKSLHVIQKTFPSIVWMMPTKHFWNDNEVLAQVGNKLYTLKNIDEFFYDINLPYIVEMRKDLSAYNNFTAPGVEMHCLYGSNIETADRLNFNTDFQLKPTIFSDDGDGQVNRRSLLGCEYWKNKPAQGFHRIFQKEFHGVNHMNMLSNRNVIEYIQNVLACSKMDLDKLPKIV